MSRATILPNHLRRRREKVFGDGDPLPLDGNAKARIMALARVLMRKAEPGKHYGAITAKAFAVMEALLWAFHNVRSGLCFPSYESIAAKAGCARSTVAEALKALEAAGLLTWVNRITRTRVAELDLFGRMVPRWKLIRISNAYRFRDPGLAAQRPGNRGFSSKSEFPSGTKIQDSSNLTGPAPALPLDPKNPLELSLIRLGKAIGAIEEAKTA